jgi:hypothetical protein
MHDRMFEKIVGVSGPTAGVLASLTEIETGLRLASLVVGLAVGLISLYRILATRK